MKVKQAQALDSLDVATTPIIQQSMAFKSKADRFENNELLKRAAMPGPGAYDF